MIFRIETGWLLYLAIVMPANAPAVQAQETERAFYAGASHMLDMITRLGEPDISEDRGVEVLDFLRDECRQFMVDMALGKN